MRQLLDIITSKPMLSLVMCSTAPVHLIKRTYWTHLLQFPIKGFDRSVRVPFKIELL